MCKILDVASIVCRFLGARSSGGCNGIVAVQFYDAMRRLRSVCPLFVVVKNKDTLSAWQQFCRITYISVTMFILIIALFMSLPSKQSETILFLNCLDYWLRDI